MRTRSNTPCLPFSFNIRGKENIWIHYFAIYITDLITDLYSDVQKIDIICTLVYKWTTRFSQELVSIVA